MKQRKPYSYIEGYGVCRSLCYKDIWSDMEEIDIVSEIEGIWEQLYAIQEGWLK